jgi:hypothetical protein
MMRLKEDGLDMVGAMGSTDPKVLLAGLCLLLLSLLVAFVLRHLRRSRQKAVFAPRPMAAGSMIQPLREPAVPQTNGRKVISIIHDFGHPRDFHSEERRYLSTREAFEVLAEIRAVPPGKPIDVILHTPGGDAFACELIASALKERPNTTAYVPYCAMSAGTIIALATEKIVMGKYACLGPIDMQLYGFPVESYLRLMKDKPIQSMDDLTVLLGYLAEKESKNARARACELLNKSHFGKDEACRLTDFLVAGDMPHSEQIDRKRAVEIGVNIVEGECPPAIYDLVEERLKIFRSLDESEGIGPDYAAKQLPPGEASPKDLRAALAAAPAVMWRKP